MGESGREWERVGESGREWEGERGREREREGESGREREREGESGREWERVGGRERERERERVGRERVGESGREWEGGREGEWGRVGESGREGERGRERAAVVGAKGRWSGLEAGGLVRLHLQVLAHQVGGDGVHASPVLQEGADGQITELLKAKNLPAGERRTLAEHVSGAR